jgi:serine/threonine-protein kinase
VRAHDPFFSPGGDWLGFAAGDRLWKVPVAGGPRIELAKLPGFHKGSTWDAEGILSGPSTNTGLFRVAPEGGELAAVTELDASKGEASQRWPELLPDGRHVLCTVKKVGLATFDDADIAVYSMDSRQWKTVLHGGYYAKYAQTGHLLYVREGEIMAAPFDLQRLEVTGPATRVVSGVMSEPSSGAAQFDLSRNGTLVFAPGGPVESQVEVLWIDREGKESLVGVPARSIREVSLSPDGTRVAVVIAGATDAIFVYDFARGTLTRATSEGNSYSVLWMADGENLLYSSDRDSGGMFRSRADGSGTPAKVLPGLGVFTSVSIVGSIPTLVYPKGKFGARNIWLAPLQSGTAGSPLLVSPFDQWDPQVSPDGKWLAYVSDESGRAELYVSPFPSGAGRWQISTDGAGSPKWSADGKELFFLLGGTGDFGETKRRRTLVSVSVATGDSFVPGRPRTAFEWSGVGAFSLAPDAKRLLVLRPRDPPVRTSKIYAVLNWFEELRKLAPLRAR